MLDSAERIREAYRDRAQFPDWLRAHGWQYSEDIARRTIEDIREKLDVGEHHHVLDVGCGTGAVLNLLLTNGQTGVGVDLSADLLARGRDFGVDGNKIALKCAEAASLPLPDEVFDRVLCYSTFPYFAPEYARRAVQEMIRVAKPGGRVLIGDVPGCFERLRTAWRQKGFSRETLRALLKLPAMRPLTYALLPLRAPLILARRLRGQREEADEGGLRYNWFTHAFFRRIGRQAGCRVEILHQQIPERREAHFRFDVLIRKPLSVAVAFLVHAGSLAGRLLDDFEPILCVA